MMRRSALWPDKSKRQLKGLDKKTARQITNSVEGIREGPHAATDRLAGTRFFKLRAGGYRVVLDLRRGNNLLIFAVEADGRKRIYKQPARIMPAS